MEVGAFTLTTCLQADTGTYKYKLFLTDFLHYIMQNLVCVGETSLFVYLLA